MDCIVSGCEKPAAPKEGMKCYCHAKRRTRHADMSAPPRERHETLWDMVSEAWRAFDEADPLDDKQWQRARDRLRVAMRRYVLKIRR